MAYATVNDLERRWRLLSPSERERAEVLLEDASAIIYSYDPKADEQILSIVCCNMVRRAMDQDTIGNSYAEGWEADNPVTGLEPDWKEIKLIRGRSQSISSVLIG